MKNEQEIVRSVFDAYIRETKATSTKKDRPTFDMLEKVKNRAIKALEQPTSDDCVSRKAVDLLCFRYLKPNNDDNVAFYEHFCDLPPVTPTHGTCKNCKHCYMDEDGCGYHCEKFDYTRFPVYADFYCADYEKRGNKVGWSSLENVREKVGRGNEK